MRYIKNFSEFLEKIFGINSDYILTSILIIIFFIISRIIIKIFIKVYNYFNQNEKLRYAFNKRIHIIMNVILIIIIFFLIEKYLKNIVTIISFISAAMTIALKEIIVNFFVGIYKKNKKPFQVEDRIEIADIEGDVVNINIMNFELLEINNKNSGEQSTGIIINIPNSFVFSNPVKNYVKAFKYIWSEIQIKIDIDSDLKKTKGIIYRILNKNDTIRNIPIKMRRQIMSASSDYRIYYNKLEPIIYTKIVDNYVELSIRFLMHPKKLRNVEDYIYSSLLLEHNKGEIVLYKSWEEE